MTIFKEEGYSCVVKCWIDSIFKEFLSERVYVFMCAWRYVNALITGAGLK